MCKRKSFCKTCHIELTSTVNKYFYNTCFMFLKPFPLHWTNIDGKGENNQNALSQTLNVLSVNYIIGTFHPPWNNHYPNRNHTETNTDIGVLINKDVNENLWTKLTNNAFQHTAQDKKMWNYLHWIQQTWFYMALLP